LACCALTAVASNRVEQAAAIGLMRKLERRRVVVWLRWIAVVFIQ
jgi:hypothetical protein